VERAQALAALASGLQIVWRHDESLAICEQAMALSRAVGAHDAELRALTTLGSNLAYLGRGEEGVSKLKEALELAEELGDPGALHRAYVSLTDVLTMLGRPGESARVGEDGLAALRPYGKDLTVLAANWIEALLAIGEWNKADDATAKALRAITANYPHMPLILRADLELGRGNFDAARAHLEAARPTVRHEPGLATYDGYLAELALWERRWTDADETARDGMGWARARWGAQIRVWLCAKGLRAQAELAALARARRDAGAVRHWLNRARRQLTAARSAAGEASAITPNAAGWLALAEAEYERARGATRPESWAEAAAAWDRLERPPLAAYCRWREAEVLVAAGAPRTEASMPLQEAHAVAVRMGAKPLLRELELLAQRARLDLTPPDAESPDEKQSLEEILGLTPREAEVLTLVARGYTNREIAATLVISMKTASVHVSHILRKLGVPNRREAAAIAHRFAPPPVAQPHN
jgi:DNA-binding CsgD family transcriptional regulator/tetratricopeptide (TPR) repeat protein